MIGRRARIWHTTLMALVLLAVALAIPGKVASDDAPPDVVLSRFVGVWKTEALIRNLGPPVRELRTFGRAAGRLIHDGRFVEFRTSSIDPPGVTELQVMTYEPEAR